MSVLHCGPRIALGWLCDGRAMPFKRMGTGEEKLPRESLSRSSVRPDSSLSAMRCSFKVRSPSRKSRQRRKDIVEVGGKGDCFRRADSFGIDSHICRMVKVIPYLDISLLVSHRIKFPPQIEGPFHLGSCAIRHRMQQHQKEDMQHLLRLQKPILSLRKPG